MRLLERDHPLRTCSATASPRAAGGGSVVLVAGEAGIGKTRPAARVRRAGTDAGAVGHVRLAEHPAPARARCATSPTSSAPRWRRAARTPRPARDLRRGAGRAARRARGCSSSRTCTGPTRRRWTSCGSSPAASTTLPLLLVAVLPRRRRRGPPAAPGARRPRLHPGRAPAAARPAEPGGRRRAARRTTASTPPTCTRRTAGNPFFVSQILAQPDVAAAARACATPSSPGRPRWPRPSGARWSCCPARPSAVSGDAARGAGHAAGDGRGARRHRAARPHAAGASRSGTRSPARAVLGAVAAGRGAGAARGDDRGAGGGRRRRQRARPPRGRRRGRAADPALRARRGGRGGAVRARTARPPRSTSSRCGTSATTRRPRPTLLEALPASCTSPTGSTTRSPPARGRWTCAASSATSSRSAPATAPSRCFGWYAADRAVGRAAGRRRDLDPRPTAGDARALGYALANRAYLAAQRGDLPKAAAGRPRRAADRRRAGRRRAARHRGDRRRGRPAQRGRPRRPGRPARGPRRRPAPAARRAATAPMSNLAHLDVEQGRFARPTTSSPTRCGSARSATSRSAACGSAGCGPGCGCCRAAGRRPSRTPSPCSRPGDSRWAGCGRTSCSGCSPPGATPPRTTRTSTSCGGWRRRLDVAGHARRGRGRARRAGLDHPPPRSPARRGRGGPRSTGTARPAGTAAGCAGGLRRLAAAEVQQLGAPGASRSCRAPDRAALRAGAGAVGRRLGRRSCWPRSRPGRAGRPRRRRAVARARLRELGVPTRPARPARPATRANPAGLTERQLDVLALLVEGLSNADIAAAAGHLAARPPTTTSRRSWPSSTSGRGARRWRPPAGSGCEPREQCEPHCAGSDPDARQMRPFDGFLMDLADFRRSRAARLTAVATGARWRAPALLPYEPPAKTRTEDVIS